MTSQPLQQSESFFSTGKIVSKIIKKWYILIISVGVCLMIAYLINRYTVPVYQVSTTVYLKEAKEKFSLSGLLTENTSSSAIKNLEIESIVLRSYGMVKKTVEDLDLEVSYYQKGNVKTFELYKSTPIKVVVDSASSFIPYYLAINCQIKSQNYYTLQADDKPSIFEERLYVFGKKNIVNGFSFTIYLDSSFTEYNNEIIFKVNNPSEIVAHYQGSLGVWSNGKESTALILSLQGETPEKEIDFLNRHVNNFIEENVQEKNIASDRTIAFINQLLERNSDSLNLVENQLVKFKVNNSSIDLEAKSAQLYSDIKLLDQQRASIITANNFFDYVIKILSQNNEVDQIIIPGYLGIKDPGLEAGIESMITLQLENKLLKSEKLTKNPVIEINNRKIAELKNGISDKVRALQAANQIALNDLNKKINKYSASQQQMPSAERQYVDIKRSHSISENLVQFLMQKRAEAGITQASNTSDYKIIDLARVDGPPIKPRPIKNYITAIIVGLIIPIGLIFTLELFNDKITTKEELLQIISIPLLGEIIKNSSKKDFIAEGLQKTALAESFRSIRSNLSYLMEEDKHAKVILITSSISGEGKSFCAKNLAYIVSISGKKTILVNADMRKLQDYSSLGVNGAAGLSNYLSGMVPLTGIICKTAMPDLDIVKPGSVPPNPAELLMNSRMKTLITQLKSMYDYIIIDTPPIGIIADGLELMKQVDLTIYVVRLKYTLKTHLAFLKEIQAKHKHSKLSVLLNDVQKSQRQYGYGHGYYEEDKKTKIWWRRINKREKQSL